MHENAILQQIDVPIERLLADLRWQRIDLIDAQRFPILYWTGKLFFVSSASSAAFLSMPPA